MSLEKKTTKNYVLIQDSSEIDHMFEVLFSFIRQLMDIPKSDQELCRQFFTPYFVKKNTLLESAGTVHKYHNFVVSGYMRNFHIDTNGKEVTTDFNNAPRFFTSYHSFINQEVSNENLHCMTDCKILSINRKDNEVITRSGKNSQQYVEKILQYHLESSRQRIIDINTLSAKERYLKILKTQPTILQNIPINYIASYLGINPGSLSRIRQEVSK